MPKPAAPRVEIGLHAAGIDAADREDRQGFRQHRLQRLQPLDAGQFRWKQLERVGAGFNGGEGFGGGEKGRKRDQAERLGAPDDVSVGVGRDADLAADRLQNLDIGDT